MWEPQIGDPYRFAPTGFEGPETDREVTRKNETPKMVTGRIVHVNWSHRFFTVAFTVHGVELRESIKF